MHGQIYRRENWFLVHPPPLLLTKKREDCKSISFKLWWCSSEIFWNVYSWILTHFYLLESVSLVYSQVIFYAKKLDGRIEKLAKKETFVALNYH